MNPSFDLSRKALASLALFAFTAFAVADTVDRVAVVNALAGDVRYSQKGGAFVPLSIGAAVREGDTIKTGTSSHVDLDLGGNVGVVQIAPQSTFVLGKITMTKAGADRLTETQLKVDAGAIYAKINKLAKGSHYEISTPKGIAGIRGSAGYVTADCQVTMLEGLAGVAFPNPAGGVDTFLVHAGETVGPNDKPPHPAPGQLLRDIVEALRDATTHGIGQFLGPYVPPVDLFISPTLPLNKKKGPGEPDFPPDDL